MGLRKRRSPSKRRSLKKRKNSSRRSYVAQTRSKTKRDRIIRQNYDQDSKLKRIKQKKYTNVRKDTVIQDGPGFSEAEQWRWQMKYNNFRGQNLFGTYTPGAWNDDHHLMVDGEDYVDEGDY